MFSRAAFSSAAHSASRASSASTLDLRLFPPVGRVNQDELSEGRAPSSAVLSAPHVPFPATPPHPAARPASATQVRFRHELQRAVQSMVSPSAAPKAVRTYEAALQEIFPRIVKKLGFPAVPMDDETP